MGHGGTCCKYCAEDHCVCLLMALLTYQRTQVFFRKPQMLPWQRGRAGETFPLHQCAQKIWRRRGVRTAQPWYLLKRTSASDKLQGVFSLMLV